MCIAKHCNCVFFLMIRRPPRSTRTDTLFPYTTLFRSEVLFHDRRGVDENLPTCLQVVVQPARQRLQALLDEIVIVRVAGIDGNRRAVAALEEREWVLRRPVVLPQHDDGPRFRPQGPGIGAAIPLGCPPVHVTMPTLALSEQIPVGQECVRTDKSRW